MSHPRPHYDVAIITVSTNKLDRDCLRSVQQVLERSALKLCFVMVDNGSTAFRAHEYVTEHVPGATVLLREKNHGFGSSCNLGAAAVDADHYFFLNPDTRIDDPLAVDRMHAALTAHPHIGIIAPRIRYFDGRVQETCRRYPSWYTPIYQRLPLLDSEKVRAHKAAFLMADYDHERMRPVDWVQGSAFMIDGALWRELGGFDERFWMYYEDVDLCRRSWERGRAVFYYPEAELYHAYGKESAKMKGIMDGLLRNPIARTHIKSWVKYTLKWGVKDPV